MTRSELQEFALGVREVLLEQLPKKFHKELRCACAISSYTLCKLLTERGINATFMLGVMYRDGVDQGGHCWVLVEDQWILDITARQFSKTYARVRIVRKDDPTYEVKKSGLAALRKVNKEWTLHAPRKHSKSIARVHKKFFLV